MIAKLFLAFALLIALTCGLPTSDLPDDDANAPDVTEMVQVVSESQAHYSLRSLWRYRRNISRLRERHYKLRARKRWCERRLCPPPAMMTIRRKISRIKSFKRSFKRKFRERRGKMIRERRGKMIRERRMKMIRRRERYVKRRYAMERKAKLLRKKGLERKRKEHIFKSHSTPKKPHFGKRRAKIARERKVKERHAKLRVKKQLERKRKEHIFKTQSIPKQHFGERQAKERSSKIARMKEKKMKAHNMKQKKEISAKAREENRALYHPAGHLGGHRRM